MTTSEYELRVFHESLWWINNMTEEVLAQKAMDDISELISDLREEEEENTE